MKRLLLLSLLMSLLWLPAEAKRSAKRERIIPDAKHEVAISYGALTNNSLVNALAFAVSMGLANIDTKFTGSLDAEYLYYPHRSIGVGGTFMYEYGHNSLPDRPSGDHHYLTLMPMAKFFWFNRRCVGMYSRVGVGVTFVTGRVEGAPSNSWRFAFQASAIGLEVGRAVRAFIEGGLGSQGMVLAGIRYRF